MNFRALFVLLIASGVARAQCFNIDFGDGFGTPSSTYSAASGQAGFWQTINPAKGATVPLLDVNGVVTGVTALFHWGPLATSGVGGLDLSPSGDAGHLMDDWWFHNSNDYDTTFRVRFKGLEPGVYRVYSYAWWGDTGYKKTVARVARGGRFFVSSGMGAWPGHHVLAGLTFEDGTYITDAAKSPDGQLRIDYHSVSFPSVVNGLQLVKVDACPNQVYAPYCDQGTVTACDPKILAGGRPSASNAEEFQVEVVAAAPGREGIFYFSTHGRTANPWMGVSTQCVQPPVQRALTVSSGSLPIPCSGYYALSFNEWMAQNPAKAPPAGATVQMQLMTYDPAAPASTGRLLDAIEFTIAP